MTSTNIVEEFKSKVVAAMRLDSFGCVRDGSMTPEDLACMMRMPTNGLIRFCNKHDLDGWVKSQGAMMRDFKSLLCRNHLGEIVYPAGGVA